MVPWTRGKPLAWDVTVSDTYVASYLQLTSATACAAAEKAAADKSTKYVALAATHSFVPVAIEISGVWCPQSAEFIEDLGRRITTVVRNRLWAVGHYCINFFIYIVVYANEEPRDLVLDSI